MRIEHGLNMVCLRWKRLIVAVLISWALVTIFYLSTEKPDSIFGWPSPFPGRVEKLEYPDSAIRLWSNLVPILEEAKPGVESPTVVGDAVSDYWLANTEFDLMDTTDMKHGDILKMARAHDRFVHNAATRMPQYIPTKGGAKRGIVTVAGGDYFPVFMVSLRMLRRSGSTLPVEVFVADENEYEPDVCTEVLPMLGARCLILADIIHHPNITVERTEKISKYQYKIFAILFSTFDEVLFLDSDSFPLYDPGHIFDSDVYKSHGMITWPDLWATTVSPAYYLIAGQEPPPVILRASTESGQFFISRKTHFQTLLIAAYYNYFGPSHYYLLLCQGGYGRGDKSTFVPAAIAANQSFYDVSERPRAIGQMADWLKIYGLMQFDPIQDHNLTSQGKWRAKDENITDTVKPLFLHTNNPKWNPLKLTNPNLENPATVNLDGDPSYAFIDPAEDVALIPGVERQLWEEARWVGCELETKIKDWKGEVDICHKLNEHFQQFLDAPPRPPKAKEPDTQPEEPSEEQSEKPSEDRPDPQPDEQPRPDLKQASSNFTMKGAGYKGPVDRPLADFIPPPSPAEEITKKLAELAEAMKEAKLPDSFETDQEDTTPNEYPSEDDSPPIGDTVGGSDQSTHPFDISAYSGT